MDEMLYFAGNCTICEESGLAGFRRCSDGVTIVLMCDECEAIWLDPEKIDDNHLLSCQEPEFLVPGKNYSVWGDKAGWATNEEIEERGWGKYIKGTSGA